MQSMVMLTHAALYGHACIDRELYLPESWTSDPAGMKAAKAPAGRIFSTKPQLAAHMLDRAVEAGTLFSVVDTVKTRHCANT